MPQDRLVCCVMLVKCAQLGKILSLSSRPLYFLLSRRGRRPRNFLLLPLCLFQRAEDTVKGLKREEEEAEAGAGLAQRWKGGRRMYGYLQVYTYYVCAHGTEGKGGREFGVIGRSR